MNSLFPETPALPEGFNYYPGFLTEQEEAMLLQAISGLHLKTLIFQGFEAKRKVESYGYDYHFDTRKVSKGKAIPEGLDFLVEKVAAWMSVPATDLAEVLVTEYPEGSVINWHRDAPPFDIIAGVSLLSDCKFRLRPYDKTKRGRGNIISLPVARRSLYIMKGAARQDWEHCIAPVGAIRYSITLRTLRHNTDPD